MIYRVTSLPQLAAVAHAVAGPGRERVIGGFVTSSGELATFTARLDAYASAKDLADEFGLDRFETGVLVFQADNPGEVIGQVAEVARFTAPGVAVGTLSGSMLALQGQLLDFDALSAELPDELRQTITPLSLWGERREREFAPVAPVEADPIATAAALREAVEAQAKPGPELLANLAGMFSHFRTRDLVLTTALGVDPELDEDERAAGWERAMRDPDFEWIDPAAWRTALAYIAEHVTDEVAGAAWAVAAAHAWATGGYATAGTAVDRALALDPGEGLAELTRSALNARMHTASVARRMGL